MIENTLTARVSRAKTAMFGAVAVAAASLALLTPSVAHANGYIGNAYTVKASVPVYAKVLFLTVGANVSADLSDTGFLNQSIQQTLTGITLGASNNLTLSSGLSVLNTGDVLKATDATTQTTSLAPSANYAVTSTASVSNLGVFNGLGALSGVLNVPALVSADVISSQTSADRSSGRIGSTTIANLKINGQAVVLDVNADGTVKASGKVIALVGVLGNTVIGTVTINEQYINADGSLTTNAIHIHIGANLPIAPGLVTSSAGADIIISSSTAGYDRVVID